MIAESVELVVAALGTGVAAGMSESASEAVKKGYEKVTSLVAKLVGRNPDEVRLQFTESEAARRELVEAIRAAEDDAELVDAARSLLQLTGYVDQRGKFVTHVHDNTGVQIGDGNTMTLDINK